MFFLFFLPISIRSGRIVGILIFPVWRAEIVTEQRLYFRVMRVRQPRSDITTVLRLYLGFIGICTASHWVKGMASTAILEGHPLKSFAKIILFMVPELVP